MGDGRALALGYLHVLYIDGSTLRTVAAGFPESQRAMRKWTLINGVREYILHNLRLARSVSPEAKRRCANNGLSFRREEKAQKAETAETVEKVEDALIRRFDALATEMAAIEQRLEQKIMAPCSMHQKNPLGCH